MGNKRNFENFIAKYYEYSIDNFCPNKFHFWAGCSLVAAALERKVWLKISQKEILYPNIYVMLVSKPGMGKSTASKILMHFLKRLKDINIVPTQVTEAKLVNILSRKKPFIHYGKTVEHTSLFWYMSEASNSLKELPGGGDVKSLITELYDCPDRYAKATMKDGESVYENVCLNLIAGCTFQFLGVLLSGDAIFGGFASRNIYVVHSDLTVRNPTLGDSKARNLSEMRETEKKLLDDLNEIYSINGEFRVSKEVKEEYKVWFPKHDEECQKIKDVRLQNFIARKHTNILKLAMIFSVSESNEMIIEMRHWEKAKSIVETANSSIPKIISIGESLGSGRKAIKEIIMNKLRISVDKDMSGNKKINFRKLEQSLVMDFDNRDIYSAIDDLRGAGLIEMGSAHGEGIYYSLLSDPQDKI